MHDLEEAITIGRAFVHLASASDSGCGGAYPQSLRSYTLSRRTPGDRILPFDATVSKRTHPRLMRVLGLGFGLAVVFGSTVGVGILRLPGTVAVELASAWLILTIWIAGGACTLLGASSVAELAAMLPEAGGFYVYAKRAFGRPVGFVVGWGDWLNNCTVLAYASYAAASIFPRC